jgi:predicted Rossmann fold nucleotide-binding protein DprA/Smf involved in DNA uptake
MSSPTPDTQAVLLLCANLGQRHDVAKPLTSKQYSALAKWLHERSLWPRDLLNHNGRASLAGLDLPELAKDQVERLLDRGAALGVMVERWTNGGIWIVGRCDEEYPARYKTYLQHRAPPLIYGVGKLSSLQLGGLAVVGSRDASKDDLAFAQRVGAACAGQRIPLISGAAKGIDAEAMNSAFNRKGTAIGVLADGLGRAVVDVTFHEAILDGRLTLISPYEPESHWQTFAAMERNRLIYALADAALVVAWSDEKGGTWAGMVEALKHKQIPVYVKALCEIPAGNRKLIQSGAQESPREPWINLRQLFAKSSPPNTLSVDDCTLPHVSESAGISPSEQPTSDSSTSASPPAAPSDLADQDRSPSDAYYHIVDVLLDLLADPLDAKSLAEKLNVSPSQANAWLKRSIAEGLVRKTTPPVRYVRGGIVAEATTLSLFDSEAEPAINKRAEHSGEPEEQKAI